jgi:hypothetical protein
MGGDYLNEAIRPTDSKRLRQYKKDKFLSGDKNERINTRISDDELQTWRTITPDRLWKDPAGGYATEAAERYGNSLKRDVISSYRSALQSKWARDAGRPEQAAWLMKLSNMYSDRIKDRNSSMNQILRWLPAAAKGGEDRPNLRP